MADMKIPANLKLAEKMRRGRGKSPRHVLPADAESEVRRKELSVCLHRLESPGIESSGGSREEVARGFDKEDATSVHETPLNARSLYNPDS